MEDINALYKALEQADAAGDKESAQQLADYIRSLPTEEPTIEQPIVDVTQPPTIKSIAPKASIDVMGQKFTPEEYAKYSGMPIAAKPGEQAKGAFSGPFGRSIYNLAADLAIVHGRTIGNPEEAEATAKRLREYGAKTYTDTTKGWKEDPIAKIQELAGGSAPYMIGPITAALGGTAAGATGLAATVAPMIASTVQFTGSNLQRQMEQNKKLADTNLLNAGLTAIPQAALDQIGFRFIPGIKRIFGAAGKEITDEAANALIKKSILVRAGEKALATGEGMAIEGGTEAAQQLLERLQAGLSITDADARKEYFDSFVGGAALAGTLGVSGQAIESISSRIGQTKQSEVEKEIDKEPETPEELRPSRETLKRQTFKELQEKADKVNKVKADKAAQLKAAQLKAAQQQQVLSEAADLESMAPVNPMEVTDTTLTSWGLSKNSKAYKKLIGKDMSLPDNRALLDEALEAHPGKVNEQAVDTYKSLLDEQKAEAPYAGIDFGTTTISDAVLGGQTYGTPGGVRGRYGPTTDISGGPTGVLETGEGAGDVTLKPTKPETLPTGERLLSIQELLNDPNPQQRRAARRSFMDYFKTLETNERIKEGAKLEREERAKLANLKKTEYPLIDQSTSLANILNTLQDKPTYLIEDLKNTEVPDAERRELNQHARDYLLAESLRNKYKKKMTVEERAALIKEGEEVAGREKPLPREELSEDEFKAMQEEYLSQQAQEPLEARAGEVLETGETPDSIEGAFQKQYGKNVRLAKQRGLLNFLKDVSELPPELGKVSPTTKAVYYQGKGYFITNRITKEDAPRMLLHEIGAHYGLEGMLGTNNYKRVVKQIKQNHLTDKELKAAWDNTLETYPEYPEGSDNFMQEVIANIGETAPNNTIWRQIVGYIKQFLSKLGYGWDINKITADDIRDMVQHSVRVALRGKIEETSPQIAMAAETTGFKAPTYYSQLGRLILNAKLNKDGTLYELPADKWIDWINSKSSEGVKKDELEFSGIIDYLKMRGDEKVTKQELSNYLEANGPQVKEIKLGVDDEGQFVDDTVKNDWIEEHLEDWITNNYGDDPEGTLWQQASEDAFENADYQYSVREENVRDADGKQGYRVYASWSPTPIDDTYYFSEEEAMDVADDYFREDADRYAEEIYKEYLQKYNQDIERVRDNLEEDWNNFNDVPETKYGGGRYTLPGGNTNYAEIILTLDTPKPTSKVIKNVVVDYDQRNKGWALYDADNNIRLGSKVYDTKEKAESLIDGYIGNSYTIPKDKKALFQTFHWDDIDNPIAHYRVNKRVDKNGNIVLFVEEIQSDWAQTPNNLRKEYIRKLAKEKNISKDEAAKLVPRDWGFKKELTAKEIAELNDINNELKNTRDERAKLNDKIEPINDFARKLIKFIDYEVRQRVGPRDPHEIEFDFTRDEYLRRVLNQDLSGIASVGGGYQTDNNVIKEIINLPDVKLNIEQFQKNKLEEQKLNNLAIELNDKIEALKIKQNSFAQSGKIARGPWIQDTEAWSNLILKNIIRFAVDQGYDKVAFVNGKQAAYKGGRLDEFEEVFVTRNSNDTYNIHATLKDRGGDTRELTNIPDEKLESYLGNIADKARALQPGETDGWDADTIKIPSQGMEEYYDYYIPRYISKLLKKMGGGNLETISFEPLDKYAPSEQQIGDQIGFTITQEMAKKASQGQPLFARASKQQLDDDLKKSGTVGKEIIPAPTTWDRFKAEPIKTLDEMIADFRKNFFSFDAAINNKILIAMRQQGVPEKEVAKSFYEMRVSQAVKADQLADMWMVHGGIKYDPESFSFVITDFKDSMSTIREELSRLAKKYNVSEYEMYQYGNAAFVSNRSLDLIDHNKKLKKRVLKLLVDGKNAAAKKAMDNYKLVHQTPAEIKHGMNYFKTIPELKNIYKTWNKNRRRLINFAVDYGLYSREKADELLDVIDYVPFYREAQVEANKVPKPFTRGLLDTAVDKRLKGSYQPVHNVFDNMERWARYTLKKAINNKAAQEKIKFYAKYIPDDIKVVRGTPETTNVVGIWQDGKVIKYEFQGYDGKSMVDGFTGLEPVGQLAIPRFLNKYAAFQRAQIVLEPLFNFAQITMDSFDALITSGIELPVLLPLQVVKEVVLTPFGASKARAYLKERGTVGKHDWASEYDNIDIQGMKQLKELKTSDKMIQAILSPLKYGVKGLKFLGMVSDNVIRQAVWSQVMLETKNAARATYVADEIINFRRTGSNAYISAARQMAPFVNANLQAANIAFGTMLLSGITPDTKLTQFRRLITSGAQITAAILLLTALNSDDDDYNKLDPKDRDRLLILPGSGGYALPVRGSIIALVYKILPEHLYNRYIQESEDSEKLKKGLSEAFKRAIAVPTGFPTLLTPLLELSLNLDTVTGLPLRGQSQKDLEADLQYSNKYTSQLARWANDATGVSPILVQNFMNRWLASTSMLISMFTNKLIGDIRGEILPEKTIKEMLLQLPSANKFITKQQNTRNINDYYELNDIVNSIVESANRYKDIDYDKFLAYQAKDNNGAIIEMRKELATISRDLENLRKWENKVYSSKDTGQWTPQTKKQELDRIEKVRQDMLGHQVNVNDKLQRRIQSMRQMGGL